VPIAKVIMSRLVSHDLQNGLRKLVNITSLERRDVLENLGKGKLTYPFSAECRQISAWGFGGQNLQPDSREGGRDTGVGRSSSI